MEQMAGRLRTGLVLGGGAARGAYEAGVLAYLRDELSQELDGHVPLDIVSGTSVGAINACFIAGSAADPAGQGANLIEKWKSLQVEDVLRVGASDLFRGARDFFRRTPLRLEDGRRAGGLVDPRGLESLVRDGIDWKGISRNIRSGRIEALSVSATRVATGHTTVFIQRRERNAPPWSRDPHYRALAVRVNPFHAMASAALPLLFPAVPVGGELYVDGGLRQNVPLSPALRLGADRVIVVSLRHKPVAASRSGDGVGLTSPPPAPAPDKPLKKKAKVEAQDGYPTGAFLLGKTLDALLLDRVDEDLDRLRRYNAMLEAGTRAYGSRFEEVINSALVPMRNVRMRYVRNLLIYPSQDLGMLAAEYARSPEFQSRAGGLVGRFLRRMVESEARDKADLASYLLFDGGFAEILADLGRRDARAAREEWIKFFSEEPQSAAEAAQLEARKAAG